MGCSDFDVLLVRRAANTLADPDRRVLEAHLAECADCRDQTELIDDEPDDDELAGLPRVAATTFTEQRLLGEGGMGTTVLVRDRRLDRLVALKRPHDHAGPMPELLARFEREARLTARLQHPAIVSIYEAGHLVDGDRASLFYTMQPVFGDPLQVEIDRRPTIALRLALLPHLTTIANAVAYAHEQGIVHRDIKPANILVGQFGEAVLIDWGLAKEIGERDAASDDDAPDAGMFTRMGAGTANYMPPEQAAAGAADARVDVYALGATLYHLLASAPPYGDTAVRARLAAGPPESISAVCPDAPAELVSIVNKAMARDPAQRFASARDLAAELSRFQTGQLVESHHHSARELLARWLRRHRAAVLAAGLALIAVALIGAFSISRVISERTQAERAEIEAKAAATTATASLKRALLALAAADLAHARPLGAAARLAQVWTMGDHRQATRDALAWALTSARHAGRTLHFGADNSTNVESLDAANEFVVATSTEVLVLGVHGARLAQLAARTPTIAVDPARGRIAIMSKPHLVQIVSARLAPSAITLEPEARSTNDPEYVDAAFSRDGAWLAVGDAAGRVTVWSLTTGRRGRTFAAGEGMIQGLAYGGDGTLAIANYNEDEIGLWTVDGARRLRTLTTDGGPTSVRFSHDGTRLVAGGGTGTSVWDTASWTLRFRRDPRDAAADAGSTDATFAVDDALMFDLHGEHVLAWDADGRLVTALEGLSSGDADLATTRDGTIAASSTTGELRIWPPAAPAPSVVVDGPLTFTSIAVDAEVVATLAAGRFSLVDRARGRVTARIDAPDATLGELSDDGCGLAAIARGELARFSVCGPAAPVQHCALPAAIGKPIRVLASSSPVVYGELGWAAPCDDAIAHVWCPGCKLRRLTAQFGGKVAILDRAEGAIVRDLVHGTDRACGAICASARWFSVMPDGARLLIVDNQSIAIMSLATGNIHRKVAFPVARRIMSIATSSDGSIAAVGDDNGYVTLFDLDEGLELFSVRMSVDYVRNVELVRDSLVMVTNDRRVRELRFDSISSDADLASEIRSLAAQRIAAGDTDDLPLD